MHKRYLVLGTIALYLAIPHFAPPETLNSDPAIFAAHQRSPAQKAAYREEVKEYKAASPTREGWTAVYIATMLLAGFTLFTCIAVWFVQSLIRIFGRRGAAIAIGGMVVAGARGLNSATTSQNIRGEGGLNMHGQE